MRANQEFAVVVFGATGFTGRLVVDYINRHYAGSGLSWALAGRDYDKLCAVRESLGVDAEVPVIVADGHDSGSMASMVKRASIVLTTVGPYQLYGDVLLAACAEAGTDYVDLCGEPAWMYDMIEKHSTAAQKSGARIVFSCGFDSIPFDLGVFFLQQTAIARLAQTAPRVRGRVRAMKGSFSGGTLASFKATMAAAGRNTEIISRLKDPFSLCHDFRGPEQPRGNRPEFDASLNSWLAPFVMASINTKNIHRSNLLLGHQYGTHFVYDEMLVTGPGEKGKALAQTLAAGNGLGDKHIPPGEGPTLEERENGSFDILMIGEVSDGREVRISVSADCDPGYAATSKMIVESALCLLENPDEAEGGIWTPAPAMGSLLIKRLREKAGLTFVDETREP